MSRRLCYILLISILFSVTGRGQNRNELEAQKQKAYEDLKLARELMDKTSAQRSSSMKQLRILQQGINTRATLISSIESEINSINKEIRDTENSISELSKENEKNKEEYARLIYFAYRNHTDYEKLMYIMAGATISQSYQRYKYLKYISDYRVKKAVEIDSIIAELDLKKETLNLLRDQKLGIVQEKENEQEKLVGQRIQETVLINNLKSKEAQLRREIEEKERIARELETRIREIIEEEARKSNSANIYSALTPEQELIGRDFEKNRGKLPWPVDKGIITVGYGRHEVAGLVGSNVKNNGIDISSSPGTEVRAVFEGDVTKVFAILGANYTVLIRHGEYLSVYQNLINVRVKTGDKVQTKQTLGEAFTDSNENIASIHFEVWKERTILNPEEWISK
jgi:septal ring factor EnvC (AmiA/AmiB activator)